MVAVTRSAVLRLSCGHSCINKCHSEPLHNAVICPCPRSKSAAIIHVHGHATKNANRCATSKCLMFPLVRPYTRTLECYKARDFKVVVMLRCEKQIERHVPGSEHTIKTPCYVDVAAEDFRCSATCEEVLPCGHTCLRKCEDCNIRIDRQIDQRNHGKCRSQCGRPCKNCSHRCMRQCHGEESSSLSEAP